MEYRFIRNFTNNGLIIYQTGIPIIGVPVFSLQILL